MEARTTDGRFYRHVRDSFRILQTCGRQGSNSYRQESDSVPLGQTVCALGVKECYNILLARFFSSDGDHFGKNIFRRGNRTT